MIEYKQLLFFGGIKSEFNGNIKKEKKYSKIYG